MRTRGPWRGCGGRRRACRTGREGSRRFRVAEGGDDGVEGLPGAGGLAAAAVDDKAVRVLGDLGVEVVEQHAEGGFLNPALAAALGAARARSGRGWVHSGHDGVSPGESRPSLYQAVNAFGFAAVGEPPVLIERHDLHREHGSPGRAFSVTIQVGLIDPAWPACFPVRSGVDNTMPLRDHFHTTSIILNWEALHGIWPAAIVTRLNSILPKEFVAQPRVRVGP